MLAALVGGLPGTRGKPLGARLTRTHTPQTHTALLPWNSLPVAAEGS